MSFLGGDTYETVDILLRDLNLKILLDTEMDTMHMLTVYLDTNSIVWFVFHVIWIFVTEYFIYRPLTTLPRAFQDQHTQSSANEMSQNTDRTQRNRSSENNQNANHNARCSWQRPDFKPTPDDCSH